VGVGIDQAGNDCSALQVNPLARLGQIIVRTQGDHFPIAEGERGNDRLLVVMGVNPAVVEHDVGVHAAPDDG
jgi:hypothetical protein